MLTRTRNELIVAGATALLLTVVGGLWTRTSPIEAQPVRLTSDAVPGDGCPTLTSWVASPLQTSVGAWIDVGATAADPDPGERVAYAWEPAANFGDANAPTARYLCRRAGRQLLTLRVTDDHRPRSCTTRLQLAVDCVAR